MTTFSELADLIELYAGRAGVVGDSIDRKLVQKLAQLELARLYAITGLNSDVYTLETETDTREYELPAGFNPIKVSIEDEMISEISYAEAVEVIND